MKAIRSFLSLATSLCAIVANAQDVIIFRNGEETEVKVEEITPNEVKYKKTSNPDGPSYIFNKDDIFMIKYKMERKTCSLLNIMTFRLNHNQSQL